MRNQSWIFVGLIHNRKKSLQFGRLGAFFGISPLLPKEAGNKSRFKKVKIKVDFYFDFFDFAVPSSFGRNGSIFYYFIDFSSIFKGDRGYSSTAPIGQRGRKKTVFDKYRLIHESNGSVTLGDCGDEPEPYDAPSAGSCGIEQFF